MDIPKTVAWMESFRAWTTELGEITDNIASHPVQDLVGQRKHYIINELPMVCEKDFAVYEDKYRNEHCAICLEPVSEIHAKAIEDSEPKDSPQKNGLVLLSDTCSHFFCRKELLTWLEQKNDCPLCRASVYVDEERVRRACYVIIKFQVTCMDVHRMVNDLKCDLQRLLSRGAESALVHPTQIENSAQVDLNVDVQPEAPSASQQTEVDHGNPKTDVPVDSGAEEGSKARSESIDAELQETHNVALARLQLMNVMEDFFDEIQGKMENIFKRVSETTIFSTISVSTPVSSLVQPTLTNGGIDAGGGTGAVEGEA